MVEIAKDVKGLRGGEVGAVEVGSRQCSAMPVCNSRIAPLYCTFVYFILGAAVPWKQLAKFKIAEEHFGLELPRFREHIAQEAGLEFGAQIRGANSDAFSHS